MKKKIIIAVISVVVLSLAYTGYQLASSRNLSPAGVAEYQMGDLDFHIHYNRPFKRGRLIFGPEEEGALVPYGAKWRTGANAATEIHLNQDVILNGEKLNAGTYSIYTIPGPNEWTVVFNSNLDYWGASLTGSNVFDEEKDVLRIQAQSLSVPEELEQFTIDFQEVAEGLALRFRWDKTEVRIPIQGS